MFPPENRRDTTKIATTKAPGCLVQDEQQRPEEAPSASLETDEEI